MLAGYALVAVEVFSRGAFGGVLVDLIEQAANNDLRGFVANGVEVCHFASKHAVEPFGGFQLSCRIGNRRSFLMIGGLTSRVGDDEHRLCACPDFTYEYRQERKE